MKPLEAIICSNNHLKISGRTRTERLEFLTNSMVISGILNPKATIENLSSAAIEAIDGYSGLSSDALVSTFLEKFGDKAHPVEQRRELLYKSIAIFSLLKDPSAVLIDVLSVILFCIENNNEQTLSE